MRQSTHLPCNSRPALSFVAPTAVLACLLAAPDAAHAAVPACEPPNVLILLDISGSMNAADKPGGKYAAAVAAIDDIVTRFGNTIRFGLMVFPDPASGAGYCAVTSDLAVAPGLNRDAAIRSYLLPGESGFFGGPQAHFDTPMKQALDAAGSLAALADPIRRSHILLITDGMQDCCRYDDYDDDPDCLPGRSVLDPFEAAENRTDLAETVGGLAARGLPVFVVGFGKGVDVPALNGMAVAAGTGRKDCDPWTNDASAPDVCYHPADSTEDLVMAMSAIAGVVYDEVCDGLDNDCDGLTDEGFAVGAPCDGWDDDLCRDGVLTCTSDGGVACVETTPPGRVEVCNGIDDDCDGRTDEGLDVPCESACGRAIRRCIDGAYGLCESADPNGTGACRPDRGDVVEGDVPVPLDAGPDGGEDAGPPRPDTTIRIADEPDAGPGQRFSGGGCAACSRLDRGDLGGSWLPLLALAALAGCRLAARRPVPRRHQAP